MPSGSGMPESSETEEMKEEEKELAFEGEEIENLMEKGKKISLEDFQMIKVIGRGSFGKVYLVRHKES